jgi:CheY-like chemotaxis protein
MTADTEHKHADGTPQGMDDGREKTSEGERAKAWRLEEVTALVGHIAHELNNILMAVQGNISLAKIHATPGTEVYDRLIAAEKPAQRAKGFTQQLLAIARGGATAKRSISLNELIQDTTFLALKGTSTRCEFAVPDDLWLVEVDEGQIRQAIHNVIVNAQQAMPDDGVVHVHAENVIVPAGPLSPLAAGRYVAVSVIDHGMGIAPEHLPRVFDPHFTTKPQAGGLGLSTASSIIRNHHGHISVESELGEGTIVKVYLPAVEKEAAPEKKEPGPPQAKQGRVLVMDDEEIVRDVVGRMLTQMGYDAEFAADGEEAIDLYKQAQSAQKSFDAVILDLTIPMGIGVRETMKRLREVDPDVRAVVSSGFSNDPIMVNCEAYGFRGALAKPYRQEELGKVLNRVVKKM